MRGLKDFFEMRVKVGSDIFRIFCCFDKGNLVVLFNAFQKKSQKTPPNELKLAKELKKQYFIDKKIDEENENRNNKKVKK